MNDVILTQEEIDELFGFTTSDEEEVTTRN